MAILERTAPLAEAPISGPRFSIGLNSGPALVGNIGSEEFRNFTAIGDTTNVAARLQSLAGVGEIVVGPETARLLDDSWRSRPSAPCRSRVVPPPSMPSGSCRRRDSADRLRSCTVARPWKVSRSHRDPQKR